MCVVVTCVIDVEKAAFFGELSSVEETDLNIFTFNVLSRYCFFIFVASFLFYAI